MTTIEIRKAEFFDLNALEGLLHRGIEEANGLIAPYDPETAYRTGLEQISQGLVFVAAENVDAKRQKLVGGLCLALSRWHWNHKVSYLESIHYYVLPEYRSRSAGNVPVGVALLNAAKSGAQAAGLQLLVRIGSGEVRLEAKERLMERAGFPRVGGNYLFQPKEA